MMKRGTMPKSGDVVLAAVPFVGSNEIKNRPGVVLFEEFGNIVVAGVTSNTEMVGIPLSVREGAIKSSVIKTNYIFTIPEKAIVKKLFSLNAEKRKMLYDSLEKRIKKIVR